MSKIELRKQLIQKRHSIPPERKQEASFAACQFLTSLDSIVVSFASLPSEIDLWNFNLILLQKKRLFLLRTNEGNMMIYHVSSLEQLELSPYGALQPKGTCTQATIPKNSIILVPGIAFDQNNHRIGYGKGYYDRFLNNHPFYTSYGIGFKEMICDFLRVEPHDHPVDQLFLF